MQRIEIDEIIKKLEETPEWGKYITKLGDTYFYEKTPIEDLFKNGKLTQKEFNFCDWKEREKNFSEFKELENIFLEIFINKYKFCPYCGKVPLGLYKNFKNENKKFFDLDHIFPKNSYKTLTYNFYNLVPICKICNQSKFTKNFIKSAKVGDYFFHPYFGYIERKDRRNKGINNKFIILDKKYNLDLSDSHSKFLNLNKMYLNSQDTYNIFNFIYDKYTKIKDEYQKFRKTSKSIEEFVDYFFKNYYPEKEQDILKYSNGKLKKDLIQYMEKILKNYYK